jgi:hypothetical protein
MVEKKKILLVSSAFYPEISPRSFRATELAKQFYREGHDVTVITKYRDFNYDSFLKERPFALKMWSKSFIKIPTDISFKPLSYLIRIFFRVTSILFEYPAITEMFKVKNMLKNEAGYDLMISFAVPHPVHWGVAWSRTKKNRIAKKWVADCGDPFMFERLDTFRKPFYFKYFEINFCEKCDYITIPFQEAQEQYYPQFKSKMRVIPQGFNFNEIRLFKDPVNSDITKFVFAGTVIPGFRDLNMFLDFLSTLTIDFKFIVYTNQKDYYSKYTDVLSEKLELRMYVDRITLIYEMSKVDFLVNVDTILDADNKIEAIPSKLIDYALSERPILNISSNKLDEEKVLKFLEKDYSGRRVINKSDFDIKLVSSKFLKV